MENDDGSHDFHTKIGGSPIFREHQRNASLGIITSEVLVENDRHPPWITWG